MPKRPPKFNPTAQSLKRHMPKEADRQARRELNTGSARWQVIRKQVLARDAYRCQACGRLVMGKEAHVDHRDNDPSNNAMDNLQTLCRQGHSRKTWAEQHGRRWNGRCA
ncbi:HNH endonuclease [Pseudoxanthomonas winnipegensis]|uniref:Putative HNH nuclease YajD n=3 Tax=Pseudomonadota TaxID=1224 RepID=A0A4Q8L4K5_9GAMM|nr:MAG: HNH endonuclease [Ancylobacter novellus]TAA20304.1 HNH endonuclease [Pseudoxanthomonas winnipegensis]